jgi:hypothetical protein
MTGPASPASSGSGTSSGKLADAPWWELRLAQPRCRQPAGPGHTSAAIASSDPRSRAIVSADSGVRAAGAAFLPTRTAALLAGGAAAVAMEGQERLGQPVQRGRIHVPGHHRRDGRIAAGRIGVEAGQPAVPARRRGAPGGLGFGRTGQVT